MASGIFNVARGRMRTFFELSQTGSSIQVVLFKTVVGDETLRDFTDLATLKASCTEADFTNYARKSVTSGITVVVDDSINELSIGFPNQTWTAAGGSTNNNVVKLITAYKPSSSATDNQIIPCTYHDYVTFTDGTTRSVNVNSAGLYRSYTPSTS